QVVVTELAVVKGVVACVNGVHLVWRGPLDHDRAGRLITGIFLPKRDVAAVRYVGLNRPLIVDLRGRENSGLRVVIESVNERVARHEIVRSELRFDVGLRNDAADTDVHSLKDLRKIKVEIDHRHIEAVVIVVRYFSMCSHSRKNLPSRKFESGFSSTFRR